MNANREIALDKAVTMCPTGTSPDEVVKAAEKYYAFLEGKEAEGGSQD